MDTLGHSRNKWILHKIFINFKSCKKHSCETLTLATNSKGTVVWTLKDCINAWIELSTGSVANGELT